MPIAFEFQQGLFCILTNCQTYSVYYMRYLQSKNIFFEALKNDITMPFDDESMFNVYIKMGGQCYF